MAAKVLFHNEKDGAIFILPEKSGSKCEENLLNSPCEKSNNANTRSPLRKYISLLAFLREN